MNKPNLFIVGAPKAGTTFLYEKLANQPDIFFSKTKELNYFTFNELKKESYYKDFKVKSLSQYLKYYNGSKNSKYLVDASVSYFTSISAPFEIQKFNPTAKIIIILRDPVDRAFSHYIMDNRMGVANKPFEHYLTFDTNSFHYKQYIGNSSYVSNIKKFKDTFGEDKVLVIILSQLNKSIDKIANFLEVPIILEEKSLNERVNSKKETRNSIGKYILKNRWLTERVKALTPDFLRRKISKSIYKKAKDQDIDIKTKKILSSILKEDILYYNNLLDEN